MKKLALRAQNYTQDVDTGHKYFNNHTQEVQNIIQYLYERFGGKIQFCGIFVVQQIKLATVTFQLWEKYANINFQQSFENPNIIIPFKYKDHLKERDSKRCGFTLDNNELAHALFPLADNSVSKIHNQNKDWKEELYDISKDKLSLFIALAHEIGHAIGIDHSLIHQSLMHSIYHEPTSPFNAEDLKLSEDDQLAVASLYGQRKIKKKAKTTRTTTTKRTILSPHSSPPAKQPEKGKKG
ncbi:hypothetical protein FQA39_LY15692 [Lamprigera yunnana]|nr:hypothetical protein FQA39_LY15692 [Lamprigera yunnana]